MIWQVVGETTIPSPHLLRFLHVKHGILLTRSRSTKSDDPPDLAIKYFITFLLSSRTDFFMTFFFLTSLLKIRVTSSAGILRSRIKSACVTPSSPASSILFKMSSSYDTTSDSKAEHPLLTETIIYFAKLINISSIYLNIYYKF